jgi:hypothetical protein
MTHPFNFSNCGYEKKCSEILDTGKLLEDITGKKVVGFRAPCYDIDMDMLEILAENGYLYDSSVYPSYFKVLQLFVYVVLCRGKFRKMGSLMTSFAPNKPYMLRKNAMLEIPISMVPYMRFPFYSTVLFSTGMKFFNAQYHLVKRLKTLTYELHSIDLADDVEDRLRYYYPGIERHPCLRIGAKEKRRILIESISIFKKDFSINTMSEIARRYTVAI